MPKAVGSAARFRQRKISVKQTLQIIPQSEIPDLEDEQQRGLEQVKTGVEEGEEEEHHLQAAINASNAASAGAKVQQVYIPTPDASKKWSEYEKYYPKTFHEPATYIRTSATVEDTSGCPYCMDEDDDSWLQNYNSGRTKNERCTEDEFEQVCQQFEQVVNENQPYLSMDPSQLMKFNEMRPKVVNAINVLENDPNSPERLLEQVNSSIYKSHVKPSPRKSLMDTFKKFGEDIYTHWYERKIERNGGASVPTPKVEDSRATEDSDNDPYVCFRRREVRQTRKTRRSDQQSSERLRKLQTEMEQAKNLMQMVLQREQMRRDALKLEWDIFEKRCAVKGVKRKLGIKGDDEDLMAHKKKKEEPVPKKAEKVANDKSNNQANNAAVGATNANAAANVNAAGKPEATKSQASGAYIHQIPAYLKLPVSKIPDMEMTLLEKVQKDKEASLRNAVSSKLASRSQQDRDWVNYTDNPFVPYCDYFDPELMRRQNLNVVDARHAAYSSIAAPYPPTSDSAMRLPLASSLGASYASRVESTPTLLHTRFNEHGDLDVVSKMTEKEMASTGSFNVPRNSAVSLRKRRGRGGRMMIDRRGLVRKPQYYEKEGKEEYEDKNEQVHRLHDRYKFDSDMESDLMDFSSKDPSRLNGIENETQSIRFGSMLLSKSFECYREAYQQRQQQLLQWQTQQKLQQQQQQQQQQEEDENQNQGSQSPPQSHTQSPTNGSAKGINNGNGNGAARPNGSANNSPMGGSSMSPPNTKVLNNGPGNAPKQQQLSGSPPTKVGG